MKFKKGVTLALRPQMAAVLPVIEEVHERLGVGEAWITSGTDGEHSPQSLHYVGLAVDLRTRGLAMSRIIALAEALKLALGVDFDVVIEATHLHIEWDPA